MSIKDIRLAHGLTQQAMADLTGIPKRTIEDWELGKRRPPEYIIRLLEFFLENRRS